MRRFGWLWAMAAVAVMLAGRPALAQDDAEADAPAYQFDLREVGGEERLTFAELADSGRSFVLFFWISDCPHCKRQLPFVELMYRNMEKYEMDVDVVLVNADVDEGMAEASIRERGILAPVYWDPDVRDTKATFDMQEKGTPRTYIFKPGGEYVEDFGGFNSAYMIYVLEKLEVELPRDMQHLKNSK